MFPTGVSPNPGGRPKYLAEWRKGPEAQELRKLSYATLKEALLEAEWKDRIVAAKELLNRVEGTPISMVIDDDGNETQVTGADVLILLRRLVE